MVLSLWLLAVAFFCTRHANGGRNGGYCGDGLRNDNEECDDGNKVAGDGCNPSCKIEYAFYCAGGGPSHVDTCFRMQRRGKHHANPKWCTQCQSRLSANRTLQNLPADHPDRSISLVTTHFSAAAKESSYINKHYREVEVALMSNLANPALKELVVLYEGYKDDNCDALKSKLLKAMATVALKQAAIFTCVPVSKQPTYRQMFEYANTLDLHGAVAIMANGDIVFDSTIALASGIARNFVAVLTVTGGVNYHIDRWARLPPYDQARHAKIQKLYVAHSGVKPTKEVARCDTRVPVDSWDGYVFRPPIAALTPVLLRDEITMNMLNAENIAGSAIINGGLSLSRQKHLLCGFCQINVVHFHASRQHLQAPNKPLAVYTKNHPKDGYLYVNKLYNHSQHPEISYGGRRSGSMFCHLPGHESEKGQPVWDRNGPYNTPKDAREIRFGKHRWVLIDEKTAHGKPTWKRIKKAKGKRGKG